MKNIEDGSAAFPRPAVYAAGACADAGANGMSLRDYFAAHAMQGLIEGYEYEVREKSADKKQRTGFDDLANPEDSDATFASMLAGEAYIIADAMLAARSAEPVTKKVKARLDEMQQAAETVARLLDLGDASGHGGRPDKLSRNDWDTIGRACRRIAAAAKAKGV